MISNKKNEIKDDIYLTTFDDRFFIPDYFHSLIWNTLNFTELNFRVKFRKY